ncbi:hypothetical protein ACFSL6_17065 [Paenibacillus thailandensis]|uniref:Large polyvalent protein associated domain-containing protein n=1 Tax=Paenibacillus thailandensis TaxID=393250 RepID=A0ABW5QZ89_9BACL
METKFERYIRVSHTIEDGNHVVRIYAPGDRYEYKSATWPVTDADTSLDAIWSGVHEAADDCELFNADGVAVHSTDAAAFAAYNAEVDAL